MNCNENEILYSYYLDKNKEDMVTVKFMLSDNGNKIIEFVIMYTTATQDGPKEVVKYDVSRKEPFHTHYYYQNPPKKVFKEKLINYGTMDEILDHLERNWHKMKIKFFD
jgi:hypothetical protein